MGWISDTLGDITSGLIPSEIANLYGSYDEETGTFTPSYTGITPPDITFKPFTVTGPSGSTVTTTATGGTTYALSPEQQAMQQQLFGGAGQLFGQAQMPTADREAEVYQRIRAAQAPEEGRQRLALEERLAQQGRLGVRTSMFGGTPEALAMEQAQSEARDRAILAAMQQAQAEQAQQAQLGGQFLQQSYAPQAALLSALSPALNVAGMADVARRQQGEFDLETAMSNLQAELGLRTGYGSLYGGVYSGLLGGLGGLLTGSGKPWWMP